MRASPAWAVLAVLLFVPPSTAQVAYELDMEVTPIAGPLDPEGKDHVPLDIQWRLTCTPEAAPGAPSPEREGVLTFEPVKADAPGIGVTGRLTYVVEIPDCITVQETSGTHNLALQARRDAPGLVPIHITLEGSVGWGGAAPDTVEGSAETTVSVAYRGLIDAKSVRTIQQGGPGETTTFDIAVTNLGNAPSLVRVEIVKGGDGWEAPATWPETALAPGQSQTLRVLFRHPDGGGWNNDEEAGQIRLTPYFADDESMEGLPVIANELARTRGVPGPALAFVVVSLAGVAMLRRQK